MKIGIDEQEALDLEFFSKRLGEISIPVSDDHDVDAPSSPCLHRVAQLHDLLTTEESTEMPEENENDDPVLPQIAQSNGHIRRRIDQCDR